MTGREVIHMALINEVNDDKVNALVDSMMKDGWVGCPILVCNGELLTGSHRVAALKKIGETDEDSSVLDEEVAEDVTDIVEANYQKRIEEDGWAPDIDKSNIGWLLEGSWAEEYKDEIEEW